MALDTSWYASPSGDVSGSLNNTYANVACPPFDPSTVQQHSAVPAFPAVSSHTWQMPDMSAAPGPNKGWRIAAMYHSGGGATGLNVQWELLNGASVVWSSPWHQQLLTGSGSTAPIHVFPVPDAAMVGVPASNLRVRVNYGRPSGGNNQTMYVRGVMVSKSPIPLVDEYSGPGPLAGHEQIAWRPSDLAALGADDDEQILVWPDATGRGQHAIAHRTNASMLRHRTSDGGYVENQVNPAVPAVGGQFGAVAHGWWMRGARLCEFRLDTLNINSTAIVSDADDPYAYWWDSWADGMQPMPLPAGGGRGVKSIIGVRDTWRDELMAAYIQGTTQAGIEGHTSGTTPLDADEWYKHTTYLPGSDADGGAATTHRSWIGDAATAQNIGAIPADPFYVVNQIGRFGFLNREERDRPTDGAIKLLAYFDLDGLDLDDLDAARDVWVNGPGDLPASGTGTINSTASLAGTGTVARSGRGVIAAVPELQGTGATDGAGTGTIAITGTLQGAGYTDRTGTGTVAAVAALSGRGTATDPGVGRGAIEVEAQTYGTGHTARTGSGHLAAVAALQGRGSAPDVEDAAGTGTIETITALAGIGHTERAGQGSITVLAVVGQAATPRTPHPARVDGGWYRGRSIA